MTIVSCTQCRDEGHKHRWKQTCPECCQTFADTHLAQTGHTVTIAAAADLQLPADGRTQRLTGRRGW